MVALLWDSINCSRTDGLSNIILDAKSPAAVNETSSPPCSACWHVLHTSAEVMAQALRYITVTMLTRQKCPSFIFSRSRIRVESQMMS